ncbi:formate dehydrogenase accessory protein FdhE [Hydrogenophaga bisanensis]|uniref:Protein FdhE homolog n=1 Tax=Hydrogenophaga bisanensis TaxID=439611 RepID=A0ABW2R4K9_9BURK
MTASATVRVMSPEEIAARAGEETPFLHWPQRESVFAEREMRLRQLARGHAMEDYLGFLARIAHQQQGLLKTFPSVPLPDAQAADRAARAGLPLIPAADWPRDPAWRQVVRDMSQALSQEVAGKAAEVLSTLADADEVFLERQADALLHGLVTGLDLATAPVVGAALQVYWTHMLLATRDLHQGQGQPFGRIDDETVCPCCGSRPTASVTRSAGESLGQRYLHCSLCGLQWHMVRIKCPHCLSGKSLAYQSLTGSSGDSDSAAATAKVQAETCDDCGTYLKIVHTDRDPFVDPVADDVASVTLDLLVAETGKERHGVNFMLLFGDGGGDPPPDQGGQ